MHVFRAVCLITLACIALISHALAQEAEEAPNQWPIISTEELHTLQQSGTKFLLVDVLPNILYDEAHIPGSINIPVGAIHTTPNLPKDKNTLLVFYCMGVACIYSGKAAHAAYQIGYHNLRIYREGIVGWQRAGLPVKSSVDYPKVEVPLISARQLFDISGRRLPDNGAAFLLDIRPADHFARGHIKGSINIDIEVLHEQVHLLPQDQPIILIDNKGKRPLLTGRFLASKGLKNLRRLDGGFNAWVKSGLPVEQTSELKGLSQCDRC